MADWFAGVRNQIWWMQQASDDWPLPSMPEIGPAPSLEALLHELNAKYPNVGIFMELEELATGVKLPRKLTATNVPETIKAKPVAMGARRR